jgi:hypothetical protein
MHLRCPGDCPGVAWSLPGDGGGAVEFLGHMALGADGVVLRYGQLFGPGTYYPVRTAGPPCIHVDEAARRTVTLLEARSGIATIFDDVVPVTVPRDDDCSQPTRG